MKFDFNAMVEEYVNDDSARLIKEINESFSRNPNQEFGILILTILSCSTRSHQRINEKVINDLKSIFPEVEKFLK